MTVKLSKFRAAPASAGCWIDENRGWRAVPMLVEIAHDMGMTLLPIDEEALHALLHDERPRYLGEAASLVMDQGGLADQAKDWLNAHVAPKGHYFDWADGNFVLQPEAWWEAEARDF